MNQAFDFTFSDREFFCKIYERLNKMKSEEYNKIKKQLTNANLPIEDINIKNLSEK